MNRQLPVSAREAPPGIVAINPFIVILNINPIIRPIIFSVVFPAIITTTALGLGDLSVRAASLTKSVSRSAHLPIVNFVHLIHQCDHFSIGTEDRVWQVEQVDDLTIELLFDRSREETVNGMGPPALIASRVG